MEAKKKGKVQQHETPRLKKKSPSLKKKCRATAVVHRLLYYSETVCPNEKTIQFKLKPIWRENCKPWENRITIVVVQNILLPLTRALGCSMSPRKIGSSEVNCSLYSAGISLIALATPLVIFKKKCRQMVRRLQVSTLKAF